MPNGTQPTCQRRPMTALAPNWRPVELPRRQGVVMQLGAVLTAQGGGW